MKTEANLPWYVQKGHGIKGPFMSCEITRYMLHGRIKPTDLVRSRLSRWEPVSQVPWLVPETFTSNISIGWTPA